MRSTHPYRFTGGLVTDQEMRDAITTALATDAAVIAVMRQGILTAVLGMGTEQLTRIVTFLGLNQ